MGCNATKPCADQAQLPGIGNHTGQITCLKLGPRAEHLITELPSGFEQSLPREDKGKPLDCEEQCSNASGAGSRCQQCFCCRGKWSDSAAAQCRRASSLWSKHEFHFPINRPRAGRSGSPPPSRPLDRKRKSAVSLQVIVRELRVQWMVSGGPICSVGVHDSTTVADVKEQIFEFTKPSIPIEAQCLFVGTVALEDTQGIITVLAEEKGMDRFEPLLLVQKAICITIESFDALLGPRLAVRVCRHPVKQTFQTSLEPTQSVLANKRLIGLYFVGKRSSILDRYLTESLSNAYGRYKNVDADAFAVVVVPLVEDSNDIYKALHRGACWPSVPGEMPLERRLDILRAVGGNVSSVHSARHLVIIDASGRIVSSDGVGDMLKLHNNIKAKGGWPWPVSEDIHELLGTWGETGNCDTVFGAAPIPADNPAAWRFVNDSVGYALNVSTDGLRVLNTGLRGWERNGRSKAIVVAEISSGRHAFDFIVEGEGDNHSVGLATCASFMDGGIADVLGVHKGQWGWHSFGSFRKEGAIATVLPPLRRGAVITFALDMDAGMLFLSLNGSRVAVLKDIRPGAGLHPVVDSAVVGNQFYLQWPSQYASVAFPDWPEYDV